MNTVASRTTPILSASQCALLALYAECMFDKDHPEILNPPLDPRAAADWQIIGYLTAVDALFGLQKLGFGQRVFYGFVAFSKANPSVHIAVVRGTEDALEWFENIRGFLHKGPPIGLVEAGFYNIYETMRYLAPGALGDGYLAAQGIVAALPEGATMQVMAHSLGSAIATYLMTDVARIPGNPFQVQGTLIASPKTGDAAYVKEVDRIVGADNYTVYNYVRDTVPHIPPSLSLGLGFQDLPHTIWITPLTAQALVNNNPICNHHPTSYAAMLDFDSVPKDPYSCVTGRNAVPQHVLTK